MAQNPGPTRMTLSIQMYGEHFVSYMMGIESRFMDTMLEMSVSSD